VIRGPLRVTLTTGGGFAAGLGAGRRARSVQTPGLDPADDAHLRHLLRAAGWSPAAGSSAGGSSGGSPGPVGADAVSYRVTVERLDGGEGGEGGGSSGDSSGGGEPVVLVATDVTLTEALADLVDWIEEHSDPA